MKTLIENLRNETNEEIVDELIWEKNQILELLENVDDLLVRHKIPTAMTVLQTAIEKLKK